VFFAQKKSLIRQDSEVAGIQRAVQCQLDRIVRAGSADPTLIILDVVMSAPTLLRFKERRLVADACRLPQ